MRTIWIVLAAVMTTIGCSGSEAESAESEELATVARGVDTNGPTLDIAFAQSQGMGFVGRYISFDGTHPALTAEEAQTFHAASMPLVLIWEIDQQRAFQNATLAGEQNLGTQDGSAAQTALQQAGAFGQVVYFTVDYDVTDSVWNQQLKDANTNQSITIGDLVTAYFQGINSVLGAERTGAYGTYTTLHELFAAGRISYGWQQTFNHHWNDPREPRAQLRQFAFGYDTDGWGVSGAGALDYDRAVNAQYGQWN